jgi:hypothetical protein
MNAAVKIAPMASAMFEPYQDSDGRWRQWWVDVNGRRWLGVPMGPLPTPLLLYQVRPGLEVTWVRLGEFDIAAKVVTVSPLSSRERCPVLIEFSVPYSPGVVVRAWAAPSSLRLR